MRICKIDIPLDDIEIVVIGDVHIGSKKCDYKKLQQKIDYVAETNNARVIMLGDIINNSTKTSVGDVYEEPLSPMQQMQKAVELFTPIKDKIIAGCSGNHERRTYKQDGIDLSYFLASELGYADNYDPVAVLLSISYGSCGKSNKCKTFVYLTHGDGAGGRTIGGKANALERRGQIVDADIVITGHTHQPIIFTNANYDIDRAHDKVILRETTFVNIGSTLDYEEYAELFGMRPSSAADPRIYLTINTDNHRRTSKCTARL